MDEPTKRLQRDSQGRPERRNDQAEQLREGERTSAEGPADHLMSSPSEASTDDLEGLLSDELIPADSELLELEEAYKRALAANEAAESLLQLSAPTGPDQVVHDEVGLQDVSGGTSLEGKKGQDTFSAPAQPSSPAQQNAAGEEPSQRLELKRVIEALLFVGAEKLTTKRLCRLLGEEVRTEQVLEAIDELNSQYLRENRPYEIQPTEGGYRMVLRREYEKVRNRVYGLGPREVRLSQEALDVLALVAYYQPITRAEIEEKANIKASGLLRQLLRRELIRIQRDEQNPKNVRYTTTPRFLSLFGLSSLDDLPQLEDFEIK